MQQANERDSIVYIPGTDVEIKVRMAQPAIILSEKDRLRIEAEIEARIALLDAADGDPDLYFDGDEFEEGDAGEDDDPLEDDELAASVDRVWAVEMLERP